MGWGARGRWGGPSLRGQGPSLQGRVPHCGGGAGEASGSLTAGAGPSPRGRGPSPPGQGWGGRRVPHSPVAGLVTWQSSCTLLFTGQAAAVGQEKVYSQSSTALMNMGLEF